MGKLDFLSSIIPQWAFGSPAKEVQKCPVSHSSSSDASQCPAFSGKALPADAFTPSSTTNSTKNHLPASFIVDPSIIDTDDLSGRLSGDLLVASPYTEKNHLLDLTTLSRPNQLLAKALTIMNATSGNYANVSYEKAFNWGEILIALQKLSKKEGYAFPRSEFYVIVFRSRLPFDANREHLGKLDEDAHEEAVVSGQLLKYWFGTPHPDSGRNLATCIWRHRGDAKIGGGGPGHVRAMEAVRNIYLEWRVERLKLIVEDDASEWRIEDWVD
ncbi:hypothetical protein TWF481_003374 [Arthrobotrys musiformis]|uniref:Uncharacterized protein n=1 Tax=Arthrobotrys musiformis TaxID=47236 RepID=A0AAV9VQ20_9PEZI